MTEKSLENDVIWDEHGVPYSRTFSDTYFDRSDGLQESRHVFVDGCELTSAWAGKNSFTVCELGFGSGLNFLATWDAWQQTAKGGNALHYVGIEGSPLAASDMRRAHSLFPQISGLSQLLVDAYPAPRPGFHRLWFKEQRVCLTLLIGHVDDMLAQTSGPVDAWFLDGFAPDRNPEMWAPSVLESISALSADGARVATYSVAGAVRRGLENAGFNVAKRPGHGKKRHALSGANHLPKDIRDPAPWFRIPSRVRTNSQHIAVIGAGIAGACVAHAARQRGLRVTVIDKNQAVASEASSVPWAVLSPRFTAEPSVESEFYAQAWRQAIPLFESLTQKNSSDVFRQIGTFIVAPSAEDATRHDKIIAQRVLPEDHMVVAGPETAEAITGIPIGHGGFFLPRGGLLQMSEACQALLRSANVILNQSVASIERRGGSWALFGKNGEDVLAADAVVLASGISCTEFDQCADLPLRLRHGQLTSITSTGQSEAIKTALAGKGTVTPVVDGGHVIGATFDHFPGRIGENAHSTSEEADIRNVSQAHHMVPRVLDDSEVRSDRSWANVRSTTPDHLPIAGPVAVVERYPSLYGDVHHGRHWKRYPDAPYHDGLFVLGGLGARGATSAPLLAELIVSEMCGEPLPVSRPVADALHPARFTMRALRRATNPTG